MKSFKKTKNTGEITYVVEFVPGEAAYTKEIKDWLHEHCAPENWKRVYHRSYSRRIEFTNQEDQFMFLLRWAGGKQYSIGYKGYSSIDSATYYCPYIPIYIKKES